MLSLQKNIRDKSECAFVVLHVFERGCCVYCVQSPPTELKELSSSLTTEEMVSEIQELKAECSGYRARLEKIKSATNHVTPEEKEKVRDQITQQIILETE